MKKAAKTFVSMIAIVAIPADAGLGITPLSRKHYAVNYPRKRFHDPYDALISQD